MRSSRAASIFKAHWAIVDTSVYIDYWEGRIQADTLLTLRSRFIIRQSSVVLSELRRGARTSKARRMVDELGQLAGIRWTPTDEDWWRAGSLIQTIGDAHNWDTRKRQEFQNDTLIALSAQRHGAAVVTANDADFVVLGNALNIPILVIHP